MHTHTHTTTQREGRASTYLHCQPNEHNQFYRQSINTVPMAEEADQSISARTIRKLLAFATDENFETRLIRDIRTRLDHLHDA